MKKTFESKSGSALLVTLLVVSLLLVVVVTFSAYVRMELRAVNARMELIQARQNAKLAMHLALARLQETAGPDQRVTAIAEILGDGVANPNAKFWTGVWEQSPAGGVLPNPDWLVSGNVPDPAIGAGGNPFTLFPATASESPVQVPLVSLSNPGGTGGNYAYWVADEGVKASAIARRGAIPVYEHAVLNPQRRGTEYQTDFGVDLSPFFTNPTVNLTDTLLSETLERVSGLHDLTMVTDSLGDELVPASTILDHAHDLTPLAMGVLENAFDGGLKKNLSDPDFRDSFLATDELHRFLEPKGGELAVDFERPSDRGVLEGQPFFGPRPLLTEAVVYMGIFHTWSDAKLRIRYHFEAEFINPYPIPLIFPPDFNGSYNRGMVLYFENLPSITARDMTAGSPTPDITEDLNNFSAYPASDSRRYINSWFDISPENGRPNVPMLEPGEVYRVMEPNPATQPRGLARDFGTVRWSGNQSNRPLDTAQIEISATHPPQGVTLKVVPYQNSGNPKNRIPMLSLEGLVFDDFSIVKTFRSGPNPFSRPTSGSYLQQDYTIAYHFRVGSDATDTTSMRDILTSVDLRDPDFAASDSFDDIDGITKTKADLLDPIYTDPSFIVTDDVNLFSELDQLTDGTARSHDDDYTKALFYDIPDGDTLSVGQLSSLHIYKRAPRSIGNPWGGIYNRAFDRYYFSPQISHPAVGMDDISANPAILYYKRPPQILGSPPGNPPSVENYAQFEMTLGQFNLNSTSAAAWEAVLAGPILTPTALDEPLGPDLARASTFLRLPQHQSGSNEFFVTNEEIEKPENAFAQGLRSLNDSDGQLQLKELARNIVTELKTRTEPFSNLEEFVNSGILQEAINKVGVDEAITGIPPINQGVYEYSNVFLTQSDLLTKLAPYASSRSDTFKIRAYGSSTDVNGNRVSSALCEAIVQRLPEKVDGSNPMTPSSNILDMRTFEIISFRWLTDEES